MKNKPAVIFDFNGTLFWDSEYQEKSWDKYLVKHNIFLTDAQKKEYIHGRNGKDTFEILFERKLSKEEVDELTEEKKTIYRAECMKQKMELAPGAVSLLNFLKEHNIPMAIATASGKGNVEFFIDKLGLLDYFSIDNIIYDDGTVKGKPDPDIFERAIKRLGADKNKTIIFEDSVSGIQAAQDCGAGKVIIVNSTGADYSRFGLPVITHFNEFDRGMVTSYPQK